MFIAERTKKWLDVVVVILRVVLIALGGATADQLLVEGRVGLQLAAPLQELSSKSSGVPLALLLPARSPLA